MKKIITFGTFDVFHQGHENFLRQAKKYGDYLLVVIARDKIVEKVKGKLSLNSEKDRLKTVKNSGLADKVVLGHLRDMYAFIKKYKPDVICLGYDQTAFVDNLKEKLLFMNMKNVRIIRLKSFRPDIYKSSKIKINNAR